MAGNDIKKDDISAEIIDRISKESGTDSLNLPPLFEGINPDALQSLFAATSSGIKRSGRVTFQYAEYEILVEFDNEPTIRVEEISTPE